MTEVDPDVHVLDDVGAGDRSIRGGGLRVAGFAAGSALSLLTAPLLTRHLGVDGFGRYVVVLSLIGVVSNFSDAGLVALGMREYSVRTIDARNRMLGNLLGMRLATTFAGALVAVAFAAISYPSALVAGTVVAAIGLLLTSQQHTYTVPLSAELRLGAVTLLDLARQVLTVVGLVSVVLADGGVVSLLAVSVPVGAAVIALTALLLRGVVTTMRPRFDRAEWGYLGRQALPYAAATAAGAIYYKLAILVLSLQAPERETGLFSVSLRVVEALIPVAGLLSSAVFPIFARSAETDRARLRYVLQRTFDTSVILGALMALSLSLSAGTAIRLLGGDAFLDATGPLRLQAVALAATFVIAALGNALLALQMQRWLVIANLCGVAVVGTLTFILSPSMGVNGAAVAMVASETVLMSVYAWALFRAHPDLRVSIGVLPRVAAAVAVGAAAALLPLPGPDIVTAAVGTLAALVVLAVLRAYPDELVGALRSILPGRR